MVSKHCPASDLGLALVCSLLSSCHDRGLFKSLARGFQSKGLPKSLSAGSKNQGQFDSSPGPESRSKRRSHTLIVFMCFIILLKKALRAQNMHTHIEISIKITQNTYDRHGNTKSEHKGFSVLEKKKALRGQRRWNKNVKLCCARRE